MQNPADKPFNSRKDVNFEKSSAILFLLFSIGTFTACLVWNKIVCDFCVRIGIAEVTISVRHLHRAPIRSIGPMMNYTYSNIFNDSNTSCVCAKQQMYYFKSVTGASYGKYVLRSLQTTALGPCVSTKHHCHPILGQHVWSIMGTSSIANLNNFMQIISLWYQSILKYLGLVQPLKSGSKGCGCYAGCLLFFIFTVLLFFTLFVP